MTPGGNIQESSKSTIQMIKDSLSKRFFGKDESPSKGSSPALSSIELLPDTKGKSIDFNNLTQSEINRRGLLDPQPTGLRDITGNSFTAESSAVLNEIKTFNDYLESSSFPKTAIQIVEVQPEELKTEENKSGFKSLFDQIRLKRNDKDVTATPNISNVGLQTPIQDRLDISPSSVRPKPSISNLFEETMNLFDDNPIDTGIDTSEDSSTKESEVEFVEGSSKSKVDSTVQDERKSLFNQIKSQRKEYGTPIADDKELTSEDSESSEDSVDNANLT
jgi:hypothetical protein